MTMTTHGTCSECGGPVQSPMHWGGNEPPPKKCTRCGAVPNNEFGPVIPMKNNRSKGITNAYDSNAIRKELDAVRSEASRLTFMFRHMEQ